MSWNLIRTIAFKEILDGFRDRRALFSALLFPLFGPAIIAVMIGTMASSSEQTEETRTLPVKGAEHAPNLIKHLEQLNFILTDAPENPEKSIKEAEEDVILVIDKSYPERFKEGRSAGVELIYDSSRIKSNRRSSRIEAALESYSQNVAHFRLLSRGISPQIVRVLSVQSRNLATPQTRGASLFEMIVMFGVMAAFLCNMYIAIDTTAGERERGSLEPLLINPVSRTDLVLGKWIATILYGLVGVGLTLICAAVVMTQVPLEAIGMRVVFGMSEVCLLFVLFAPLVLLAGAFQLFLASFARSFKEAQTYLSLVLFLPMLPGMYLMFQPSNPSLWMAGFPALGQQVLAGSILRGDMLGWDFVLISILSCLIMAGLSLWLTVRLFRSETFFFKN